MPSLGCWEWLSTKSDGYGQVHIFGRNMLAHRVIYELLVRGIGRDRELDHLCRFHPCVNPAHLEIVTSLENKRRGQALRQERLLQAERAQEAGGTFLTDLLAALGEEGQEHSQVLVRRLAELSPEKYAGWTAQFLGAMLRRYGIETRQMWRGATADGRGINLRGVRRIDVLTALNSNGASASGSAAFAAGELAGATAQSG